MKRIGRRVLESRIKGGLFTCHRDTSREELWRLMNFPSFLLLGSVPFLKLSTPGVLRSDLAHNHQVHKRFDPIYNDARQRIQNLGTFGPFGCTRGVGLVSCYL